MGRVIGIDLGTTNSCVAIIDRGEPVVAPNAEGSRTTPSMVAFAESGERLVGQVAKRQAITNPENTIFAVKRLIGRRFKDPEVQRSLKTAPYRIVEAKNGDCWVMVRGREFSPSEISAMILTSMKRTAEDYLGEQITDAVITVPAYFDESQRRATRDAGRIAGLNVLRIINEPTAAALAYGLDRQGSETVAVYDLGGGTFDISILQLGDGVFEVKATSGDTHLGGEDFDFRVINWLAEGFKAEFSIDLRLDRMALQRLKEAAEKAKHELSASLSTDINLPFITADATGPKHLNVSLTRGKLETLCEDLIDRTFDPVAQALQDSAMTPENIQTVIMVGGMTRMPRIQQRVSEFFGREADRGVNPDVVVAIGAAVQGAVLDGQVEDVLLLDVTPLTLGVETAGGVATPIIKRNTTVPCRQKQVFSTAVHNQPMVSVHIVQGEREMAGDNKTLARFELHGIPPAPRGVPQIEVTFDIDANGILTVTARDLGTGKASEVRVTANSGLSEEQIQKMLGESKQYAEDDARRREEAEARVNAEGLVYTAERSLAEFAEMLPEVDARDIRDDIDRLKAALKRGVIKEIIQAHRRLETSSHRIADVVYGQAVAEAGNADKKS